MTEIRTIADGLNIEGGYPGVNSKKWANIVTVLDCPLNSGQGFDTLLQNVKENKWPTLECGVEEINEQHMVKLWIATIGWYMKQHKSLTVEVHQFPEHAGWWVSKLGQWIHKMSHDMKLNCLTEVLHDNPTYKPHENKTEMTISLSQCAGWGSQAGTILIPDIFIPFDGKTIDRSNMYATKNQLICDYDRITKSQYWDWACAHFADFKSANCAKKNDKLPAVILGASVLQVAGIWIPKKDDQYQVV